jgi:hypothetical protein
MPKIKCPKCDWVGDSDPSPVEIYDGLKTTVIKTQDLNRSSESYGWRGNYAECPNCSENLSHPNRLFKVNPEYLIKEEIEGCGEVIKFQEDSYGWQLFKKILLEVESSNTGQVYLGNFSKDVKFNYFNFCCCVRKGLDANLITKTTENNIRLTWTGHDFLANASTEWKETILKVNIKTSTKDLMKTLEDSAKKRYGIN